MLDYVSVYTYTDKHKTGLFHKLTIAGMYGTKGMVQHACPYTVLVHHILFVIGFYTQICRLKTAAIDLLYHQLIALANWPIGPDTCMCHKCTNYVLIHVTVLQLTYDNYILCTNVCVRNVLIMC